ncbi:ABC transporter substrate-binding protein [Planotetraspora kaengkrachanensis]|uniref:Lipoprotein n=1 Tax=Planotetraspora kaengkrachanensis TaxID=575193 RepID=A0A8J3M1G4_9ACTN|nr:ABC transporter substrate-binding protein [Planotetraspora kaengkrachanensis]GIG77619.1 lipoprotein [Planotetraspora kaengkrachanensis]
MSLPHRVSGAGRAGHAFRPLRSLSPIAVALLLLAGCGAQQVPPSAAGPSPASGSVAGFPVTVADCGVTATYQGPPRRAVSLNQHATEIMLALGLEKSMVGTAYLDDSILPEYKAAYDGVKVLAEDYPSYEALLSAEPDFVYGGFASAFDEKEGRGRDALMKAGIGTYLNTEGCTEGPVTTAQVDEEVRNIGKIFGVSDRADRQITAMHDVLDDVRVKIDGVDPVTVFVYDSGDKTAFTAGGAGIGNEMIKLAAGTNVFADLGKAFGDVSFEQVAERAPDAIVIYDYGDESVEQKKAFLLGNPALKDVPAIKNRRFAVLPLSSTVLGVRVPVGVRSLAQQLHPDRFA